MAPGDTLPRNGRYGLRGTVIWLGDTESAKRVLPKRRNTHPSTAQHRWRRFLAEHPDFPPVTIENMRHSFATAYLDAGGRIETLSRILGHANISTTINRYYRPDVKALRNDFERITQESRIDGVCAGQRLEFDSPRLHHIESSLMQVIADYFSQLE